MKYGKQYLESLESVPEEWRKQAIEYRKLKKVINRVASELKDLGLTSEVLKELLENQQQQQATSLGSAAPAGGALPSAAEQRAGSGHVRWASTSGAGSGGSDDEKNQGSETRIEEVIDEAEGVVEAPEEEEGGAMSEKKRGKMKAEGKEGKVRKRKVRATYELSGTTANPEPRIHLVFSSCSSESYSSSNPSSASDLAPDPSDSNDSPSDDLDELDDDELAASPAKFLFEARRPRKRRQSRKPGERSKDGRLAELLASSTPTSSTPSSSAPTSASPQHASSEAGDDASDAPASESGEPSLPAGVDVEFEGAGPHAKGLLRRMYGVGEKAGSSNGDESEASAVEVRLRDDALAEEEAGEGEEKRPRIERQLSLETIKAVPAPSLERALASVPKVEDLDVQHLSLGELEKMKVGESEGENRRSRELEARKTRAAERAEEGDDESEKKPRSITEGRRRYRRHRPRQHRREVFIPLSSDTEFLTLLASALNSLATLQLAQKRQFTESVRILADEVSEVSSPARPKTDLYIWREIFALWVEAAIFESDRERDRGERGIEEVEQRLEWFVDQVAKRKLAKRMRNKQSRVALEKFIALNVELLDLKKFQLANEEAARKILKKHDKRTALTASYGFPQFLNSTSSTSDASDPLALISSDLVGVRPGNSPSSGDLTARRVLTLPGFPSLPHILLSTFTTTLLPIIPALEDYECSICGDVAFKPIRLSCGHKFCVRCLVKMQKRGQDSCPQCRSAVVLRANAGNLDHDLQDFLLRWFPREVKAKEKSNSKEAAREELEEMGLADRKCVVM